MIQKSIYVIILLNIPELAASIKFLKYLDSPFYSKPNVAIRRAINAEVMRPIIIHHNIPKNSPNPKIPAAIPIKILAITRLFERAS